MFIFREEMYAAEGERNPEAEGIAEIIIGKQRNGPTGTVRLAFLKQYTRFENLAPGAGYGRRGRRVIRPTVATVSLDAHRRRTCARFRTLLRRREADAPPDAPAPGRHRRRQGQRLRPRRAARSALALEAAGASMLACADIEEGVVAARGRRDAFRFWCSARSASAISTACSTHRLTPTVSTPGRGARARATRPRARGVAARAAT